MMSPNRCAPRRSQAARATLLASLAVLAAIVASGCSTSHPRALASADLVEAQAFPYFPVYWAGPSFEGFPLAAVDGLKSYQPAVGDSVYYGDCASSKGVFEGGSCLLPLQVTTVVYRLHSNFTLGPQRNIVVRGAPAVVYDEGRSIEIYSGHVAIDIFADTYAHAYAAATEVRPLNAAGSASRALPRPIYCPGLSGRVDEQVSQVMRNLPLHICEKAEAAIAFGKSLNSHASSIP